MKRDILLDKLDVEHGFEIASSGVSANFVREFKALEQLTSKLFPMARTHEEQPLMDVLTRHRCRACAAWQR